MGWPAVFSRLRSLQACPAGGGSHGRREGPAKLRRVAAAGLAAVLVPLTACGGEPAQIVDYAPQRGTVDVSTATPVRISFDHDVNRPSVESRLHLAPDTTGSVRWITGHDLVYDHATLRTNTTYEVILEAGYQDLAGNTYTLRHHWSFITEAPPSLSGSSPGAGERGIDPASYLSLSFTRTMSATSLQSAITLTPGVPFDVRPDPAEPLRVIVAPSQLLHPNTTYQVAVSAAALDVDGNPLSRLQTFSFSTGPPRPLHGWITFSTTTADGTSGGLWIVDPSAFPRALYESAAARFSWSPDGGSVLVQADDESWSDFTPGVGAQQLDFKGAWASPLAANMGYIYLDDSEQLHREAADGSDTVIASNVAEASVSPNGLRVLFIHGASDPKRIWGYDVGLRASYLVASDSGPVSAAAWAPSGNRIAYLRQDASTLALRVRNLGGNGSTATSTTGDLGAPAWLPDSTHILLAAGISTPEGEIRKAFVVNTVAAPSPLTASAGLPGDAAIDVDSPVPSPDGHQIAFLSGGQVWLMNADGTRPVALTKPDPETFPYSCRAVAWTRT